MRTINVINLKNRKDRWVHISMLFDKYDINIKRFDAIHNDIGWIGCTQSHINIIKNSKKNNDDFVIVMEDDVELFDRKTFYGKYIEIISYLEENLDKWDIFQFSTTFSDEGCNDNIHMINKKLNIIEYQYGKNTSFIIYNMSTYDKIISYWDNLSDDKNRNSGIIDQVINKFNFRQWTVIPFLTYQMDGFSNIAECRISYKYHFKQNELFLWSQVKL